MRFPLPSNTTHVLSTSESEELDLWSSWVGFDLRYLQLGGGSFQGEFRMNVGGDFCVIEQSTNIEYLVEGAQTGDFVSLFVPRQPGRMGRYEGVEVPERGLGLMAPGQTARLHAPDEHQMATVLIPAGRVHALLQASGMESISQAIPHVSLKELSPERFARVSEVVNGIIGANNDPGVIDRDLWLKQLEQELLPTLLEGAEGEGAIKEEFRRINHSRVVKVALEYIDERFGEALAAESLAIAIGVSPRTLYYSFRDILDMTPNDYLVARRLRAARDLLRRSTAETTTVTAIAVQCGFGHLSHFAAKYHARYGEYPSETLKGSPR